jgi:gamma-glutamyltranspeptidase/glutathione hydrolase
MRLTIADRNQHVGDPDFVNVPVAALLSKPYARRRAAQIDRTRPIAVARPGDLSSGGDAENTTHLTVVDRHGNMVSLTQTLGAYFGSGVVAGRTGVLFSNQMRHLHLDPRSPSRVEPGKRPRSNQSPLIVLKDGRPFMALGTPGNDAIWQRLPQVLANVIDFGMDIQTAITSARMIYGGYQETGAEIAPHFRIEDRMPSGVASALRARGHTIDVIGEDGGRVNGIIRDPRTGFLTGGADPRGTVYAIGW